MDKCLDKWINVVLYNSPYIRLIYVNLTGCLFYHSQEFSLHILHVRTVCRK